MTTNLVAKNSINILSHIYGGQELKISIPILKSKFPLSLEGRICLYLSSFW